MRDTTVREKGREPPVALSDFPVGFGTSDKQRLWQKGKLKIGTEAFRPLPKQAQSEEKAWARDPWFSSPTTVVSLFLK